MSRKSRAFSTFRRFLSCIPNGWNFLLLAGVNAAKARHAMFFTLAAAFDLVGVTVFGMDATKPLMPDSNPAQ